MHERNEGFSSAIEGFVLLWVVLLNFNTLMPQIKIIIGFGFNGAFYDFQGK
jgi:hypothetical protein